MIAYKGFQKGLICRSYKFKMGKNVTERAQAAECGFHCAENPLDCLSYYGNMASAEYYIVDAGGDISEDGRDTKISCTELTIIQKMTLQDFVLHALAYMVDHPRRPCNRNVARDKGTANHHGFCIVRGREPIATGKKGDILAFAKEDAEGNILEVAMATVDGKKVKAGKWYATDLTERTVSDA